MNEIPGVIVADDADQTRNYESQTVPAGMMEKIALTIVCSVLFALLTFWFSEAVFRKSPTGRYLQRHWMGWSDVAKGISGSPVYKINAWVYEGLDLEVALLLHPASVMRTFCRK